MIRKSPTPTPQPESASNHASISMRRSKFLASAMIVTALAMAAAIALSTPSPARSQDAPATQSVTKLTFEAADVRVRPPAVNQGASGSFGRRVDLHKVTLVDLISFAWDVAPEKVSGGPPWLATDRYEVIALPPAGLKPTDAQLQEMLKALLADRFNLVVHDDKSPVSAFALTVGKGDLKMTPSTASGDPDCKQTGDTGTPSDSQEPSSVTYTCHNMSMAAFADQLRNLGGEYFWDTTVVDQTNLRGSWNFKLKWTPKWSLSGTPDLDAVTIFDAVDKQLGLKLTLTKIPLDAIVVDGVNETPTPNPPGTAEKFPPMPTAFDVADIKPSAPDEPRATYPTWLPQGSLNFRIQRGGRIIVQTSTLKQMLMFAWDLPADKILNAPSFADTDRFDITATAPADSSGQPLDVDVDTMRAMMRTLLTDRFKVAVHNQDQTVPVYTLLALKPKLTPANPAARTDCQNVPVTTSSAVQRLVTCQNITMAQFANILGRFAPGYLSQHPVVDATGLNGAWDIRLSFSGALLAQPGASDASNPNDAVSLFDALQKQLGLKLDLQKRPIPVLVVDHAEPPTPN